MSQTLDILREERWALTDADGYWDSPLRAYREMNDLEWRTTLKIDPISVMEWCPLIGATSEPMEPI